MARARPNPPAAARLVLAPLLALVGVLVGLLLRPAALSSVPRPVPRAGVAALAVAGSFVSLVQPPEAALSLALVVSREPVHQPPRGPTFTSAAMPATIAQRQLGLRDEAGRLFDEGSSAQDDSLTSRRLGPRPQATKSPRRSFGDVPAGLPHAAGLPPFLYIAASITACGRRCAHDLRENARIESIDREAHGPRGPPSTLSG